MPTLLQINATANWGSTGRIAEQIGIVAQKHGWDSFVAYGRDMNPSKNKLIKIGSMADVYGHYLKSKFFDKEGRASRLATKRFLKEVDMIRPDIVHLHNIHDHYLNYELLFRYLAENKIPVVWTQHDQWATTGHCCYNLMDCNRWKEECHDCPMSEWYALDQSRRNHRLKKELIEVLQSLTIVPVSEWLAGNMRQSHLKERPIKVIHNGIDINVFRPQEKEIYRRYNIAKGKKIILGVASVWDKRKGLDDFYKLAESLLPSKEYAIIIVGRVFEKKSEANNVQDSSSQIIYVDRTQNSLELAQLYSAAFVFVNPSYQDNYPTTNLEAMSCGTPVITYRTGGSPEAVDEKTGIVVEQGDVVALAKAIMGLKEEPLSRVDCRTRAEEYFDKDKCFKKYVELYDEILSR